ncbi:MAG: DNA gyrase inhibitor YacG [Bosea sp. (in: a-proteobacteria)]|uniref:DNA gyrase inhibitor YacG n=1 Tax=unclassified Bosea (in: a-proteobacteria) TaxID=2653178 RepID=UPI000963FA1A|nr:MULTISPECIES: DNA gyrase inhibitor YacG [unclassified Bosea (in: a-proteobacteria)]MBN9456542.1 DNA gyrase inhibitor YacG [Bosea sp. (in: a-proteobacteria)]OJV08784.1 MAG: hypothetical protein BGO20_21135 [Bosea sp. 67-29]
MAESKNNPSAARPCPICGKPAAERYRPFCSPRCADIDLGRWLKGGYVIPGEPLEEAEDAPRSRDKEH